MENRTQRSRVYTNEFMQSFLRGDSQKEIALKESARGFTIYPVKVHRILHDPVYCGYFNME